MPAPRLRWLSLSNVRTGNVFSVTHSLTDSPWDWIVSCVSSEFECDPSALDCSEDDEGREFVTLKGEPLVEIHNARLSGNVAGLVARSEAA